MNTSPLLDVVGVSKTYRLWETPSDRLTIPILEGAARRLPLPSGWRSRMETAFDRRARTFQALHPTSFAVSPGESLGVIGRNGAGKSTLLQIIAGTLSPTSGSVRRRGRVAALLELGSGFNFEFTGRENVFLTAALQGVSRESVEKAWPELEAFAGIGAFIEQPVKTYSSGMMARLAFAAQTVLRPELFIVDEALAVGDVFFQAQCARFFKERLAAGMSLLLVSHDLPSVKALCQRAIVLHEGRPVFHGPSAEAVSFFHALHRPAAKRPRPPSTDAPAPVGEGRVEVADAEKRAWRAGATEAGSREVEFLTLRLLDDRGKPASVFEVGEEVVCEVVVEAHEDVDELQFSMEIATRHNFVVFGVSSRHLDQAPYSLRAGERARIRYRWTAALGIGEYLVDLAIGMGDRGDGAPLALLHRLGHAASFSVHHGPLKPKFFGVSDLKPAIERV